MVGPERLERGETVENEVYGTQRKSTNERGPSFVGSLGFSFWYKRFWSAWAAQIGPL
jgi:hypothetical protein